MKLYELTGQYINLMQLAEEEDLDPEVLADTLEGLDGEIEEKADGYAKVIRTLEGDIAAIKAETERLAHKQKALENHVKSIKTHLESAMIAMDKKKIQTTLFSFGIQKNPPAVVLDDETEIPSEFYIPQDPKLDKAGIKNYLKENRVPWAHLEQTESLRIR